MSTTFRVRCAACGPHNSIHLYVQLELALPAPARCCFTLTEIECIQFDQSVISAAGYPSCSRLAMCHLKQCLPCHPICQSMCLHCSSVTRAAASTEASTVHSGICSALGNAEANPHKYLSLPLVVQQMDPACLDQDAASSCADDSH